MTNFCRGTQPCCKETQNTLLNWKKESRNCTKISRHDEQYDPEARHNSEKTSAYAVLLIYTVPEQPSLRRGAYVERQLWIHHLLPQILFSLSEEKKHPRTHILFLITWIILQINLQKAVMKKRPPIYIEASLTFLSNPLGKLSVQPPNS